MTQAIANPPPSLTPPDERFWQRHSPHGEFPWSTAVSIAVHGLFLGAIIVAVIFADWLPTATLPPVAMDLVVEEKEGESGGGDGLGKFLAKLGKGNQTEMTDGVGSGIPTKDFTPSGRPAPESDPKLALVQPNIKLTPGTDPPDAEESDLGDPFEPLRKVSADAAKDLQAALQRNTAAISPGSQKGNSPVSGKGSVGGPGKGVGKNKGPGAGTSKTGVVLSRKQKHEMRWQLLASTDGDTHLKKLAALNITLAVPTQGQGAFLVYDLNKQPWIGKQSDLAAQRDKVMWINTNAAELQGLAQALGLREVPRYAAIFLPPNLEGRMASIEQAHIEKSGLREQDIEKTYWIVPMRDGIYQNEPAIEHQKLRGQR